MKISEPPPIAVVRDPDAVIALLDPERRRLARALAEAPDSASGLARRLGETRQRLNYHLRVLEGAGLLELAEERRQGSRTERVLRPTASRFVLDPTAVGGMADADPNGVGDRFSASYLVALAARVIHEVAELIARAASKRSRLATVSFNTTLRLRSPGEFEAFIGELTHAIGEVVARHHHEADDGRWFRVVGGAYPGPAPATNTEANDD
jgi:DNA-binding transcriptional ArsR family regulator